jgi:hypothetical protein
MPKRQLKAALAMSLDHFENLVIENKKSQHNVTLLTSS